MWRNEEGIDYSIERKKLKGYRKRKQIELKKKWKMIDKLRKLIKDNERG